MPRLKGNKKALTEMQTLALAVVRQSQKISFCPTADPFPGVRDGQNSVSWRWSLHLPTNPVWWGSMHAISSYRGNRSTHPPANTAHPPIANRQDRLQYIAPQLARSVIRWVRTFLAYSVMQRLKPGFHYYANAERKRTQGLSYWKYASNTQDARKLRKPKTNKKLSWCWQRARRVCRSVEVNKHFGSIPSKIIKK